MKEAPRATLPQKSRNFTRPRGSGLEDFALFLLVLRVTWVDDMSFKEIESDRIRCLIHDDNILDI